MMMIELMANSVLLVLERIPLLKVVLLMNWLD